MLAKILIAWCLVATTVLFHATALGIVLNPVLRLIAQLQMRFWPVTWLVVRITWCNANDVLQVSGKENMLSEPTKALGLLTCRIELSLPQPSIYLLGASSAK